MPARDSAWPLALLLACAARPALAQDQDPRVEQAQQAREAGRFDDAVRLLEATNRDRPGNPDVMRRLGVAYASASRYDDAIATLRQAQALAPRDLDIALALGRALLWSGDISGAQAEADRIASKSPDNAELAQLNAAIARTRAAPTGRTMGLAIGQGVSSISIRGDERTWYNTLVAADLPVGEAWTLSVDTDREDRAGTVDTRLGLRIDRRLGSGAFAHVAATVTPNADFREDWSVRAGAEMRATPNIVVLFDLRHADFGRTNVTVAEPAVRIQSGDGAFNLTLRSINLWAEQDKHQTGWALRGEMPLPNSMTLSAGGSTYPDTEAGITRRVRAVFAGIAIPLSERLTLRAVVDHEKRVETYRRTGGAISLGWRFSR